jgi:hypothetical protein
MAQAERPAALWAAVVPDFRLPFCMDFAMTFQSAFCSLDNIPKDKSSTL